MRYQASTALLLVESTYQRTGSLLQLAVSHQAENLQEEPSDWSVHKLLIHLPSICFPREWLVCEDKHCLQYQQAIINEEKFWKLAMKLLPQGCIAEP